MFTTEEEIREWYNLVPGSSIMAGAPSNKSKFEIPSSFTKSCLQAQ